MPSQTYTARSPIGDIGMHIDGLPVESCAEEWILTYFRRPSVVSILRRCPAVARRRRPCRQSCTACTASVAISCRGRTAGAPAQDCRSNRASKSEELAVLTARDTGNALEPKLGLSAAP